MKAVTKTYVEYKTPRCKCVEVHVENLVCQSPNGFDSVNGTEGFGMESGEDL